jgi:hypothetical protein
MSLNLTFGAQLPYGDGYYKGESFSDTEVIPGLGFNTSKKCFQFGFNSEHGGGWSERGGDNWIWPESPASILTLFDGENREQIVWDSKDGLPYIIDSKDGPLNSDKVKAWKDKVDPNIVDSGTDILWEILTGEFIGEEFHYFVSLLDTHLSFKPANPLKKNTTGFDAAGLPLSFVANCEARVDGSVTETGSALNTPSGRDITIERTVRGKSIQLAISGVVSAFKLRTIETYLKVEDKPDNSVSTTESTYQELLSNPVFWISRYIGLVNRVTGLTVSNVACSLIAGPDGISDSAFNLHTDFLVWENDTISNGTILIWHKAGYVIPSVTLIEVDSIGTWILSYFTGEITSGKYLPLGDFFDFRLFNTPISVAAILHYFDNIKNHNGDIYLP